MATGGGSADCVICQVECVVCAVFYVWSLTFVTVALVRDAMLCMIFFGLRRLRFVYMCCDVIHDPFWGPRDVGTLGVL